MITFYPEKLEIWNDEFDFHPSITLVPKEKTNHKIFYDRDELIGFCKSHGVELNNPEHPFTITGPENHPCLGVGTYKVTQKITLGYLKDNLI